MKTVDVVECFHEECFGNEAAGMRAISYIVSAAGQLGFNDLTSLSNTDAARILRRAATNAKRRHVDGARYSNAPSTGNGFFF